MRLHGVVDALAADGLRTDVERLARLLAGLPVNRSRDWGTDSKALAIWGVAVEVSESVQGVVSHLGDVGDWVGVIAGFEAACAAGMARSSVSLAVPGVLRASGLTENVLIGLTAFGSSGLWSALMKSAQRGRAELGKMSSNWTVWREKLGTRRRGSHHVEVLAGVMARTITSAAVLAKAIGLTPRGVGMLLGEMEELGIVRRLTGERGSWQAWATVDVADRLDDRELVDLGKGIDDDLALTELFYDVDQAMERISKMLSKSK